MLKKDFMKIKHKLNCFKKMNTTNNFLIHAVNELLTYKTPDKVIEFIKSEEVKIIILNPPFV
jgi:hypothetical protein